MSTLNKLIKDQLKTEEEDQLLGEILAAKFDGELREKWGKQLKENQRSLTVKGPARVFHMNPRFWKGIAVAASIAVIFWAVFFLFNKPFNAQHMAQAFIEEAVILHPGTTKGVNADIEARTLAIQAFNRKDYKAASLHFSTLAVPTFEDEYYEALALLLDQQYLAASDAFGLLPPGNTTYQDEVNWYYSLALLMGGKNRAAAEQLNKIGTNRWNFEAAQDLLKLLP